MAFDRTQYPPDWVRVSREIRARSGGRCECRGVCGAHEGRCPARHGEKHPTTGSRVVLTVAHLCRCRDRNHRKCGYPTHLAAMCQRCHLSFDRADHIAKARANRHAARAVSDLFPDAR